MGTPAKPKHFPPTLKRLVLGLLVTLLLMTATKFFERTYFGRWLEGGIYELLHTQLTEMAADGRLPVLVIDISKIPGGKDTPTPRQPLRELIKTIATEHPKAIAIDIDFSPDSNGWKVDDDPQFFDFCLSVERDTSVPIFLAVYDTLAEPPDGWLGLERYRELAAAGVAVAKNDKRRLIRWIQANNVPEKLPTLSNALATAYRPSLPVPPDWVKPLLEVTSDNEHGIEQRSGDEMRLSLALINYSKLQEIQNETLPTISAQSITEAKERFSGRMVLLGDATYFGDPHNVPGQDEPVAGVHVMACAAYTLAVEPLFELNSRARIALDLSIAVMVILGLERIRALYVKKKAGTRFYSRQSRLIWGTIGLIILVCILLVRSLSILWLDFLLVAFALPFHPWVENRVSTAWKNLRAK